MTMRAINLNHAGERASGHGLAQALLIAGGMAIAGLGWAMYQVNTQTTRLEADASHLRGPSQASTQPKAQAAMQREERAAAQAAMAELALPWEPLFKALENTRSPQIRLLGIEPDPKRHNLRITAQTQETQAMLDYVLLLGRQPMLKEVFLLHHERMERDLGSEAKDASDPIRFTVAAEWVLNP